MFCSFGNIYDESLTRAAICLHHVTSFTCIYPSAGLWALIAWSFLQIVFPMPPVGKTIFALFGAHMPAMQRF